MTRSSRPPGRRSAPDGARSTSPYRYLLPLLAVLGSLALPAVASAEQSYFFEETAAANWSVPYQCPDGSTVQARLLVQSTRDFESPDTEDADPTARVQFQAICPDGSSFSWAGTGPVSITSTENLKSVTATGTITVRDIFGVFHEVTIDVAWTGKGAITTTVNPSQGFRVGTSTRKQRAATATGTVTYDGEVLVSGTANHSIAPFIRTDEERFTTTGG
jgi:hypothetical protein